MIDDFVIFERGGTVLWRRSFVGLRGDPIASLIRTVLLEDRASDAEMQTGAYGVKWALANEIRVVVAVVYQRLLPPAYAGDLLSAVKASFASSYGQMLLAGESNGTDFGGFDKTFDVLLKKAEQASLDRAREARQRRVPKKVAQQPDADSTNDDAVVSKDETAPDAAVVLSAEELVQRNREAFIRKRIGAKKKGKSATTSHDTPTESTGKRGKVMRPSNKPAADDGPKLDFSNGESAAAADEAEVERARQIFMQAAPNSEYDLLDSSDDEAEAGEGKGKAGGVFDYFRGLAGLRSLTREDLTPALGSFRDALIAKNVAAEIADRLIESVAASLEGRRMESMTSVTTTVRGALDEALTRILTPRMQTDILADIRSKKGTGKPYVVVYCGVNGVGKSTSLAKTCYYLLNHGCKVMIAACDTFRAGAVEQLRTHVRCLGEGVELFDRGYGKDAASVASDAIRAASSSGYDVVLVDTAGRMQDNEPLMRALAKLVEVNRPDRVLFVGEALVGNDAVDQMTKFNRALKDFQKAANPRTIDGIVLTKFDTVEDKVGAAVSMVYSTGCPIVFVGVGQTYLDLRGCNTRGLVRALLR